MTTARILGAQNSKTWIRCVSRGAKSPIVKTRNSARIAFLFYCAQWISNPGTHLLVCVRIGTQRACLKHPRHCGTESSKLVGTQSRYTKPLKHRVLLLLGSILYILIILKQFHSFAHDRVHKGYSRVQQPVLFACVLPRRHRHAHSEPPSGSHPQSPGLSRATAAASF